MSTDPIKRLVAPNDDGIRPAGPDDACCYCRSKVGEEHKFDCVMLTVKRRIRMTVEYDVDVPQSWTVEDLGFHRHESSWCASNAIGELDNVFGDHSDNCACGEIRFDILDWNEPKRWMSYDG